MSIKLRLALLLGLLLTGFAAAMVTLGIVEQAEKNGRVTSERETCAMLLNHMLDSDSRVLPRYVAELAQSDEFATLLQRGADADVQQAIAASLTGAGMAGLWIVAPDGHVRWHVDAPNATIGADLPLSTAEFVSLVAEKPDAHFFVAPTNRVAEVAIARLRGPAGEWLIIARPWDDRHLRELAALTKSEVSLQPPQAGADVPAEGARIVLSRVLADWRGRALRTLRLDYLAPQMSGGVDSAWRQPRAFLAFGLLLIVGMWLAIQAWVLRPLTRIADSLATDNPRMVANLSAEKSELGRIAQLVRSSFEQRDALQREIRERAIAQAARERSEAALRANLEERSKLGRDLHDGVIQSLYAAGMGLAGVRSLLRPDQTEAVTRLEQSRAALNETIHDVRNFLIGLEPEALKVQTFIQAVTAIVEIMNGIRPFQSRLEIDEHVAARLTLAQRVHALQIAREAISNALRHGEASRLSVTLRGHSGQAEFEIADDGRGFDPAAAGSSGKGLANFAQRARELGGDLAVESEPGRGARVQLFFPLSRL